MTTAKAFLWAAVIFGIAMAAGRGLRYTGAGILERFVWLDQFLLKTLLAGLSLAAIRWINGSTLAQAGFVRAKGVRWFSTCAPSAAFGALSSLAVLLAGSRGLESVVGRYRFLEIVIFIWLWSSITEEIFVRGWFQSYLMDRGVKHAVWASAILFGAMHLSLIGRVDPIAVSVILFATFAMGYLTARLREQYGSLIPPIAAHISFNVGGVVGGIVYAIAYRIATGHLPAR